MESDSQTKVESEVTEKQVCHCHPLWKTREGCRELEVSSFWSRESLLLTVKKFPVNVFSFKEIKATRYDHTDTERHTPSDLWGRKTEMKDWNHSFVNSPIFLLRELVAVMEFLSLQDQVSLLEQVIVTGQLTWENGNWPSAYFSLFG